MRKLTSLLAAVILLGAYSVSAADIRVLVQRAKPAVVQIGAFDKENRLLYTGTGFFISADGFLLTNRHMIADADLIEARDYKGTVYRLKKVAAVSQETDVALLQFDVTGVPFLTLGSTANTVEGERVLVIGNPEELTFTVSDGIVSAFRDNRSIIQISAPISHGSSGSPVLDESGQVIGIATWIWKEGQNLNLAISAEAVRDAIAKAENVAVWEAPMAERTAPTTPSVITTPTPTANENLADDYFLQGRSAWLAGNYQDAINDFNETIRLWPRSGRAYSLRGDVHSRLKQYDKAISDYTEAIRLCHGSDFSYEHSSYEGRAAAYDAIGNHSQAEQDRKKAKEAKNKFWKELDKAASEQLPKLNNK